MKQDFSSSLPWHGARAALAAGVQSSINWLTSESLLVLALVVVGLITHGLHMFHYPAFTLLDDEGIYAGQAWAVLREHVLTPYTYFYDHAPGGWLLLAGWMKLSGGMRTFESMIDSGRVLMLLLHLAMIPLLYSITKKLSHTVWVAALATLLFSLSPLAIFYQRMILLDSMMLFWVLLSLDLLLDGWGRLSRLILSGVCFGLALLTKESAIVLAPAMLFIAFQQRWRHLSRFAVTGWLVPLVITVSLYPLYALMKGELFPPPDQSWAGLFEGHGPGGSHVSLIGTLIWQSTRPGGGIFNLNNQFWELVRTDWLLRDPLLLIGGTLATGLNLLLGLRHRRLLVAGLLGMLPLFYLGRGGVVLNYYILLAIPFLCLNLAILFTPAFARTPRLPALGLTLLVAAALLAIYWQGNTLLPLYRDRPDRAGREALAWIKQNIPADSMIISRDNLWPDMREAGLDGPAFPNIHSQWKVGLDPEVRNGIFANDWRRVDYLIMTPDLVEDFNYANNTVAIEAFQHAHRVKQWKSERGRVGLHPHQIFELWKVDKIGETEVMLLSASASYLTQKFDQDGAYIDANGNVISAAQGAALLRAVWQDDRAGFYRTWQWTQTAMLDETTGLPAWLWRDGAVADRHTAADGDTDIALALLMAGKRWNDPALLDAGRQLVQAIWQHEVVTISGRPYLAAGNWATEGPVMAWNPSYFAPYAYRIFQEVDPDHDWMGLVGAGYDMLVTASIAPLGANRAAGLPPNWVGIDRATGEVVPLQLAGQDTTDYGYDAARTYWRLALDWRWSKDGRAESYLNSAKFLQEEVNRLLADGITYKQRVSAVYAHNGDVVVEDSSIVGTAGAMAAMLTRDPASAHLLYAGQIVGGANRADAGFYWDNPRDLYTQEWGWFATALYANMLPDLWRAP